MPRDAGRAWLVLCACALSLVRAEQDMSEIRVTPMPADPELNAKWLEEFRRDLLRDAYEDETSPNSPSSRHRTTAPLVYRTHASETSSEATRPGADYRSDKVPQPVFQSLGAVSTRRTTGSSPARHRDDDVGHSSGEPGPPPEASVTFRAASAEVEVEHMPGRKPPGARGVPLLGCLSASVKHSTLGRPIVGHASGEPGSPPEASARFRADPAEVAVGHMPSRSPPDAQGAPLVERFISGRPPARHLPDDASVEHSTLGWPIVGHTSDEPGPTPDASVRRRATLENIAAGHRPGRWPPDAQGAPLVERLSGRPPARHLPDDASVEHSTLGWPIVGHTSDEPGPTPDASVRRRATLENIVAGHRPGRWPPDAQGAPLVERFISGRPPARHLSDDASVEHSTLGRPIVGHISGKPPARSPDYAVSRELGISRRDLYGGHRHGSIRDIGLDARRQPFLKSVHELDDQMIPVVIPHAANNDNQQDYARKSRKRLWHANSEYDDKPPYIIDQNGVKRYRVHTDVRERFFNQFGGDEPGLKDEWGFPDFDREMRLKENRNQERGDENLAQNDDDQESREESGSQDEGISVSASNELNVSEYHQENVRSRYIQDERSEREYAQRFSARRDAALLADGLASSKKPCNCETEHPPIVPEL